jgi:hypothetical protein
VGEFDAACRIARDVRGDDPSRDSRGEESLEVGEALLGGIAIDEDRPKLAHRRTEHGLQIDDRVDQLGDDRAEQAEGAEWVQAGGDEVGALERLDEDGALVQAGEPGALPHAGTGGGQQLMGWAEVDHDLGIAVGEHPLSKWGETPLDFPVLLDYAEEWWMGRRAGEAPSTRRGLVFECLNRFRHAET